jgi:hypothetical protein
MHKWYAVTFQVFNCQVWQITVQIRHAYDEDQAKRLASSIIRHTALMAECVSCVEIPDQVPAEETK